MSNETTTMPAIRWNAFVDEKRKPIARVFAADKQSALRAARRLHGMKVTEVSEDPEFAKHVAANSRAIQTAPAMGMTTLGTALAYQRMREYQTAKRKLRDFKNFRAAVEFVQQAFTMSADMRRQGIIEDEIDFPAVTDRLMKDAGIPLLTT